ncbi:MAG: glycoside hydrolase family 3 N-terminal domain-containing protein [Deltaproteobacteria bacterium]|nr:glycoside hydrolase family 3 N-terminal domain-containing protein [Deltaproteobacteria bacterium]
MRRILFLFVLLFVFNAEALDKASAFLRQVEKIHAEHGMRLKTLRGDLILGPILDVGQDAEGWNYSNNACEAALLGEAVRKGWEAGGHFLVAPKHFPGLGARKIDTHDDIEIYDTSPQSPDLIPFRYTIQKGAKAIVMGHGLYPNFEKNPKAAVPASFSSGVIGFLRNKETGLGFDGLVIVDDVLMGAVVKFYSQKGEEISDIASFAARRVVESVKAGADLVMVFYWRLNKEILDKTTAAFAAEIQKEATVAQRLDASVKRILKAKNSSVPLEKMSLKQKVSQILFLWHSDNPNDNPVQEIGAFRFGTHEGRKAWSEKSVIPTFVAIDQRKGYAPGSGKTLIKPQILGIEFKKALNGKDACL